jgi:hypothetical protein
MATQQELDLVRQIDNKRVRLKEMRRDNTETWNRIEKQTTKAETRDSAILALETEIDTLLTTLKGL